MNRGKSSLAESLLLTNFGRFCLPTRRLITREEKENSITIDLLLIKYPRIWGGGGGERKCARTRILNKDDRIRKIRGKRREGEKDDENGK